MRPNGNLSKKTSQFAVILPTLNASRCWAAWLRGFLTQTTLPNKVLVIDSSSDDNTVALAQSAGFETRVIQRSQFNHGGTRQLALDLLPSFDLLIYLTQDAVLAKADALERILAAFGNCEVGAAYGRQLPSPGSGPIEAHSRIFNYPAISRVKSLEDRATLGLKTFFLSNSFSCYRRTALETVGGFPRDIIMAEDAYVAGKMLLRGWKLAYVAEAMAYHSHDYSYVQEFKRYFDTGVLHARNRWLVEEFGTATGEGKRFVFSELTSLWPRHLWLIPSALIRTCLKFTGYRLGLKESSLAAAFKHRLSMHENYWRASSSWNEFSQTEKT